jgi:hypothetical protein
LANSLGESISDLRLESKSGDNKERKDIDKESKWVYDQIV